MRKAILIVLTMLMLIVPTYAADGDDPGMDQPIQQEQEPVIVASLEELQEAIDATEDGEIIYVTRMIIIPGGTTIGNPEKQITIALSDQFEILNNSVFEIPSNDDPVNIVNIAFDGQGISSRQLFSISGKAEIVDCTFTDWNCDVSVSVMTINGFETVISNCTFSNTCGIWAGAIYVYSGGKCTITDCRFENTSGGWAGVLDNSGDTTLGANYYSNTISRSNYANTVNNSGKLTLDTDMEHYTRF